MSVQERRERERFERRSGILEAAEQVFLAKGPAATVEEIAEVAGIAKGTVYLYFQSKEDIYLTILGKILDGLTESFRSEHRRALPAFDRILCIGEAYIRFYEETPGYFRLLNETSFPVMTNNVSPAILEKLYTKSSALWSVLTSLIEDCMRGGIFRPDVDAFELAVMLWNNASGILRQMDAMKKPNVWQGKQREYSLYNLDLLGVLRRAQVILLDAHRRR